MNDVNAIFPAVLKDAFFKVYAGKETHGLKITEVKDITEEKNFSGETHLIVAWTTGFV